MTRILLALLGVILLAVTALSVLWLAGQLLTGIGAFVAGTAGVLLKLLWFLVVASLAGGAVFFVANAWRPAPRPAPSLPTKAMPTKPTGEPQAVTLNKTEEPML